MKLMIFILLFVSISNLVKADTSTVSVQSMSESIAEITSEELCFDKLMDANLENNEDLQDQCMDQAE